MDLKTLVQKAVEVYQMEVNTAAQTAEYAAATETLACMYMQFAQTRDNDTRAFVEYQNAVRAAFAELRSL